MNYIKDRILEPSSWSAIAAAGALFLKEHSGF